MRFAPFFFLNFGLNRPFRRFRPIRPIQARIGSIPRESTRFGAASVRVGFKKMKATWHDAAGRAGSVVPRASPCQTRVWHLWCRVRASQVISHLEIIYWVLHRNTFFIFWGKEFGVLGWCCFLILGLFKKFEVEINDVLFFQIPYGFHDRNFFA